ncbi:glycosyltransferase [bacterium]|nr:MAG: glycosyltransferase [bacterium]
MESARIRPLDGDMESDERIRVMHLISGLDRGGAERMLVWSARYHDRRRFKMAVVSMISGGELSDEIKGEGVEVFELAQKRGSLTPGGIMGLQRAIRGFAPHVLQGHMFHGNMLARFTGALTGKAVVINTRHIDLEPLGRRLLNMSTRFLSKGTLAFSRRVADMERKEILLRGSVRLIPYGIEIPEKYADGRQIRLQLGLPETSAVWIAVGRLTRQKGYVHLLDAFSRLETGRNDPYLLIVGSGEDGPALERQIKDRQMDNRVRMLGSREDVYGLMTASDYFVLPSLWEGGPLVVLEAMAAGLPVVATDVGDVACMVVDAETGFVVGSSTAEELHQAMTRMMDMGKGGRRMGQAGRERVLRLYDIRRTQREVEKYYMELVGENSPGRKVEG